MTEGVGVRVTASVGVTVKQQNESLDCTRLSEGRLMRKRSHFVISMVVLPDCTIHES